MSSQEFIDIRERILLSEADLAEAKRNGNNALILVIYSLLAEQQKEKNNLRPQFTGAIEFFDRIFR
jgi:hypothetical protein